MKKLIIIITSCLILAAVYLTLFNHSNIVSAKIVSAKASWPFNTMDYAEINQTNKDIIKIAIIDTGIDNTACPKEVQFNSYSVKGITKSPTDLHGSIMANIICSSKFLDRKDNSVRSKIQIYGVNVGHDDDISIDSLVEGLQMAINLNVDIINISLGVYKNNPSLESLVKKALQKNIIIVCSAGNDSTMQSMYPASYKGVITVSSVDPNNNYMVNNNFNNNITVSAPGENIPSQISKDGKKLEMNGTSASTAIITSAIISFKSVASDLTPNDLISVIKKTSIKKEPVNIYGFGVLDYKKALSYLIN